MTITPTVVMRPWGQFEQFTHNEPSTVKLITINQGEALSLQTHQNRSEFWKVLVGQPTVTIDSVVVVAEPGNFFGIEIGQAHRIEAPVGRVVILEIALGDFDENDIVRLEDKYGRVIK